MTTINEQFEQMAAIMKAAIPSVTTNKNGYELRTKVLEIANQTVWEDYHAKWGQFETTIVNDGDDIVTKIVMPVIPGTEAVLAAAEQLYSFVNKRT